MLHSLRPCGLEPTRLLCPWGFSGRNTGEGCHFLLQGIFPGTELVSPVSPALQADSLPAESAGNPRHTICLLVYIRNKEAKQRPGPNSW